MNTPIKPTPTRNTINACPIATPAICGTVRRNPKFTPDASNKTLLGPGVTDVTKANVIKARNRSNVIGAPFMLTLFYGKYSANILQKLCWICNYCN